MRPSGSIDLTFIWKWTNRCLITTLIRPTTRTSPVANSVANLPLKCTVKRFWPVAGVSNWIVGTVKDQMKNQSSPTAKQCVLKFFSR